MEVSDIKRARTLMKSMVNTNPKNAQGWIAYARVEEIAGNLKTARTIIAQVRSPPQTHCMLQVPLSMVQACSQQQCLEWQSNLSVMSTMLGAMFGTAWPQFRDRVAMQGTEACPQSEDVWLEAARLQTPENVRGLLARGVQQLPHSVKLWMQAARVETDDAAKRRVLRKALERNSNSVRLWKAAVELHEEDEALMLLSRAVECCPDQVDLWLALVRLEPDFERAKKVRAVC